MLRACLAHAARLGINASVYLQEVTSLQLPHRYAMVFVPSGSIGLITEDEDLRAALSRIRSHMESNGRLLLELAAHDRAPSQPTVLEPRTVAGPDGTVITYSCTVSEAASPDSVRFSGRYEKRAVDRVLGTEREELILRMYRAEHLVQELATCGFRSMRVSTAYDLPFLAESGCTLVEASADACSH
jgi:hypothetical protein